MSSHKGRNIREKPVFFYLNANTPIDGQIYIQKQDRQRDRRQSYILYRVDRKDGQGKRRERNDEGKKEEMKESEK